MVEMPHKWDSVKIWHESYEKLIVLKSKAEEKSKRNLSIAEVFDAVVSAEYINIQTGAAQWKTK